LPEARVRAIIEAYAWFEICLGVMGVEGPGVEERLSAYRAQFPGMFEERNGAGVPMTTYEDEATFIAETTGIFEDDTTRVLASVRAYEEQIDVVDAGTAEDYRSWRATWLTRYARPRVVQLDGRFVAYSFVDALRREAEQAR